MCCQILYRDHAMNDKTEFETGTQVTPNNKSPVPSPREAIARHEVEFSEQMKRFEDLAKRYHNTLRILAKS